MSNTVDVEALVASFRRLLAKPITEVAGLMCSRGEIAALLDAIETRATALSTLAKERDEAVELVGAMQGTKDEFREAVERAGMTGSTYIVHALDEWVARAEASEAQLAKMEDALNKDTRVAKQAHDAMRAAIRLCQISVASIVDENPDRRDLRLAVFRALEFPALHLGNIADRPEIAREALSTAPAAREVGVNGDLDERDQRIVKEWLLATRSHRGGSRLGKLLALRIADDLEAEGVTEADIDRLFSACLTTEAPAVTPEVRRVRHKQRGTTYEVLGAAEVQISQAEPTERLPAGGDRCLSEGDELTVYRCEQTGKLWLRFPDEFEDGRFEDLPPASQDQSHAR